MMSENVPPPSSQESGNVPSPSPRKISEYVVSWRWLAVGVLSVLIFGSISGGLYYYRYVNLAKDVLDVARQMSRDAEQLRDEATALRKNDEDREKAGELFQKSYLMKIDAANLLMDFNRRQEGNIKVLTELNNLLESLLEDDAGPARQRRQSQIMKTCQDLIKASSSDKDSLPYRMRIMELEWDQGNLPSVIERAREVLRIDRQVNQRENYEALRYITLATLDRLPAIGYQPSATLPPTMDELLEKVLQMRPDNIEVAFAYAEFVIDVNNRDEFKNSASEKLRSMSQEERDKLAMSIMDDMVSRNASNINAYLARYNFKRRFVTVEEDPEKLDPDLQTVLDLNPDSADALIFAGMSAHRQSVRARQEGNAELAEERKKATEEYLKRAVEKNPNRGVGYQYLGDFYAADGKADEAIRVWNEGIEQGLPYANPELVGRIVIGLTERKQFDEASAKVALLNRFVLETRHLSPDVALQIRNLVALLTARLYAAEGTEAVAKAEEAQRSGNVEESRRLYALSQKKTSDATQILEKRLGSFGRTSHDFVIDSSSIYYRLVGESLMLTGRLMADQAQWDKAVEYYEKAMRFPRFRQQAMIAAASAYQQRNMSDVAVRLLAEAVDRDPENMMLRYLYTQSLFQEQMSRNTADVGDLEAVEEQLRYLMEHADQLPNPWVIDLRLIHLEMVKESVSNDPERILRAQRTAIRKFQALENKAFPPPQEGEASENAEKKTYSDDLGFLTELAGIYSSLAQISDLDRVLLKMRELPGGEAAYFSARINDALRRNDREGAILVIEEAQENDLLTAEQKQRFVTLMQNLKEGDRDSLDKVYTRLKTTFDQNPDSLKPQGFFLLANMALDREDFQQADVLQERLEKIEGGPELGTMWRYLKARRLLMQKDPPFDQIRQIQEEIAQRRGDWDMTYLLKASIEERFILGKEDDADAKKGIIESYQMALRCGNTQTQVWNRLLALLEEAGRTEDAQKLRRDALVRGIRLEAGPGQFPQPYQRMYTEVYESLENDPANADVVARQCMVLAEGRREKAQLIFDLNLAFGKLFLDAGMTDSAKRHLRAVAKRGGTYVYPLAVALAKGQNVDEGFSLILDEIDRLPSSMGTLVPSLLILLAQVRPSEEVFQRIDKLMTRIENGERQTLRGTVGQANEEYDFSLGDRRIKTLFLRFPDATVTPDAGTIEVFPPEEEEEAESATE